MGRITSSRRLLTARRTGGTLYHAERPVTVVAEEPLEIRVDHVAYRTVHRTPGHDIELAHGLLLADGLIDAAEEVAEARYCAGSALSGATGTMQNSYNVLELDRRTPGGAVLPVQAARGRLGVIEGGRGGDGAGAPGLSVVGIAGAAAAGTGGAGLSVLDGGRGAIRDPATCGVPTTDPLADLPAGLPAGDVAPLVDPAALWAMAGVLGARPGKAAAAGSGAAALFAVPAARDRPADPDAPLSDEPDALMPRVLREDVRPENAALACTGWGLQQELLPLGGHVLAMTGAPTLGSVRAAASAQVPVLLAAAPPTSLVLAAAERTGITLVSAERLAGGDARLTAWSAPGRLDLTDSRS
jgi:FdhD protein